MFTVEICGCTGCGKSTTLQCLSKGLPIRLLNNHSSTCTSTIHHKLVPSEKEFLDYLKRLFNNATGARVKTRYAHTLRSFNQVIIGNRSRSNNVGIIDGGLVHRGSTLELACPQMDIIEYYRIMPIPDLIIYLYNDIDTIINRNKLRGGEHDRSSDVNRVLNVYYKAICELNSRTKRVAMLKTDNEPTQTAKLLWETIESARSLR